MRQNTLWVTKHPVGAVPVKTLVFFSCQLFESDDDEEIVACAPVVKSISDDVVTVVNLAKSISISAETSDKDSLSYQWYFTSSVDLEAQAINGKRKFNLGSSKKALCDKT